MKSNTTRVFRIAIGLFLGAGLLAYWINPPFLQSSIELLQKGDIASSVAFIRSYGANAMLVSFLLVVIINCLGFLPNIFILAANGIVFGVVTGTLISWIAETVGSTIGFLLMRYLFRDYAHSIIVRRNALRKIDVLSGRRGFRLMLLARAIPYIPSGVITALGAVSSISARDYILATLIGKLPSTWIEVTLGHDLASYREHTFRLVLLLLISTGAYFAFLRYRRKSDD